LLSPKNELSIFFTGNGILMGQSSVPLWLIVGLGFIFFCMYCMRMNDLI
jgi:hypothetical protein